MILNQYNQMIDTGNIIENNIQLFVDRIIFYKDRTIKINFKFINKDNKIILKMWYNSQYGEGYNIVYAEDGGYTCV